MPCPGRLILRSDSGEFSRAVPCVLHLDLAAFLCRKSTWAGMHRERFSMYLVRKNWNLKVTKFSFSSASTWLLALVGTVACSCGRGRWLGSCCCRRRNCPCQVSDGQLGISLKLYALRRRIWQGRCRRRTDVARRLGGNPCAHVKEQRVHSFGQELSIPRVEVYLVKMQCRGQSHPRVVIASCPYRVQERRHEG